jgi:DNA-binding YbaB/EbfC family protein
MGKGMKAGKKKSGGGGGGRGSFGGGSGFGGGGGGGANQAAQMRKIQAMQAEMEKVQEEMKTRELETTAGGGAVAVTVNGAKELVSIKIDPEVMDKDDPEMLQDLILVAVNEGLRQIEEMSENEMNKLAGGLGIPEGIL